MLFYLAQRLGIFVLTLVGASVVVFLVLSVLPGDPARSILGTQASEEAVRQLRAELGLNRPLWQRYGTWAYGLLHGDFGVSHISKLPVGSQIASRLMVTGPLILLSLLIALCAAVPLGIIAAVRHRRPTGVIISVLSQVGISIPQFWAGLILITIVSVQLGFLPAVGFPGWQVSIAGSLRSLLLPALALASVQAAILTRYVRSSILEVMREDYVRTARAKGSSWGRALRRHGLRNAAIPVVTILGLQLAFLLIGAVVIENVFGLPGLGLGLLDAIGQRDLVLVRGIVMTLAFFVLVINLLVDLLYHVIDPRLRGASR